MRGPFPPGLVRVDQGDLTGQRRRLRRSDHTTAATELAPTSGRWPGQVKDGEGLALRTHGFFVPRSHNLGVHGLDGFGVSEYHLFGLHDRPCMVPSTLAHDDCRKCRW